MRNKLSLSCRNVPATICADWVLNSLVMKFWFQTLPSAAYMPVIFHKCTYHKFLDIPHKHLLKKTFSFPRFNYQNEFFTVSFTFPVVLALRF